MSDFTPIEIFVNNIFAKSVFASEAKLMTFLNKPDLKILENDPVVLTAASVRKLR
jgi:hypothetical protein